MNIYDLTAEFLQLQELLEDPDVESDEIKAAMDDLNIEIEKKADGYAKVIRNLEGNLAAVKAEQEKLTAKRIIRRLTVTCLFCH